MTDGELLRCYARERSETAFEELVRRRIGLVYSAALRQVNNDSHLAEDVTQAVFTDLARKAAKLGHHTSLTAWLYTSTRFIAANFRRAEQRRAAREKEAHAMNAIHLNPELEPDWGQIQPLLDDAVHALDDQDRQSVLLRYFERCSYSEIGARFGVSEDSARMRVNRAVEKLHDTLVKRGVTSTAMALGGLLAKNAVGAAPVHLTERMACAAMKGTAGAKGLSILLTSRFKLAMAAVVVLTGATIVVVSRQGAIPPPTEHIRALASTKITVAGLYPANKPPAPLSDKSLTNGRVLHLQIVTADTGKPIPDVPINYFAWAWENLPVGSQYAKFPKTSEKNLMSDRFGLCNVRYPENTTRLELITRKAPFADTRLLWRLPLGETIPTNYVLQVERAAPIGGTVLDADDNPVAGATVSLFLNAQDPSEARSPFTHEFYGTTYEAVADQAGRWQIDRMADGVVSHLVGIAKASNYVDSDSIRTDGDSSAERQLRDGTLVFRFRRTVSVEGIVVDANGTPIPNASIATSGHIARSGKDGKFTLDDCMPTIQRIIASFPGMPSSGVDIDLRETIKPIRLVLRPGKLFRIRITDKEGNPIPGATVEVNDSARYWEAGLALFMLPEPTSKVTDQEGRVEWTNAPDSELGVAVNVPGYAFNDFWRSPADGEEHLITLSRSPQ